MTRWLAALLLSFGPAGSLFAHHSLANVDTTTPVRVKGTIVRLHSINPHSIIYLEESGTSRRWALEGPSLLQLTRQGLANALKAGDVVEVCGYLPKEPIVWQIASTDPALPSVAGRLINAERLVFPDGREQTWGDYGVHKCFGPGYEDQHSK